MKYTCYFVLTTYLELDDEAALAFCCPLFDSLSVERLLPLIPDAGFGDLGG